jgi:hypothetical protein
LRLRTFRQVPAAGLDLPGDTRETVYRGSEVGHALLAVS